MALPPDFNEIENLQDIVRREHNKAVKIWFKNQNDNDVSTPKARLKHSCLIKDDDSFLVSIQRQWLFEITVGRAESIQAPVYGIPVTELQRNTKFKPQVRLYFREPYDFNTHGDGTPQSKSEISFRLMNETSETISRANAETLARAIKQEIATPIFVWEKGWYKSTYLDLERGYDLRLLVKSKIEGERVVKKVLSIQNHIYNNDYFQFVDHDRTYSVDPGTHRVYGANVKKWRARPRVDVNFSYAQLLVWGRIKPINLVSVGGRLRSVIERV